MINQRTSIQVLIVDDHAIVRDGIRSLLSTIGDIDVIGEAATGRDAVKLFNRLQPDIVLMDLVMPEMDGIEAIKAIMELQPEAKILVLTSFATDDMVFPAIKAGASGYLLKDSDSEELVRSIREVQRGESSIDPKIARKLLRELSDPPPRTPPAEVDPLTERELEVLKMVAQGKSNAEISQQLVISEGTARTHVSNILGKLHLASRTQATLYALRRGLASLHDDES
ncbi:MAG: response regulator transcription factor [Chloroflexota bacterium]|jgi:NarL family two-component system response regulator LiaR|nr:MAG: response regulator transcription factor [Chloroflexota bacterium]